MRSVALSALYVSGSREAGKASAGVLRSCNGDVLRSLLVVFSSPGSRTLGPPVAQQRSISSSDHRVGIAKQGHDGMADRGYLPVVPLHPRKTEDDPGDLLLGGAIPETVESLQHMAHPPAFLPREACVRRHSAAVERCKKAVNGLYPIKSFQTDRNHGNQRNRRRMAGGQDELEVLILAQLVEEERFATLFDRLSDIECGSCIAIQREDRRSRRQHDCAGVGMRKPEHLRLGRSLLRIKREIAVPNAAESCRSAIEDPPCCASTHRNHDHTLRCDGAIPKRCQRQQARQRGGRAPRSAILKRPVPWSVLPPSICGGASIPGTIVMLKPRSLAGAMPQRHRVDQ